MKLILLIILGFNISFAQESQDQVIVQDNTYVEINLPVFYTPKERKEKLKEVYELSKDKRKDFNTNSERLEYINVHSKNCESAIQVLDDLLFYYRLNQTQLTKADKGMIDQIVENYSAISDVAYDSQSKGLDFMGQWITGRSGLYESETLGYCATSLIYKSTSLIYIDIAKKADKTNNALKKTIDRYKNITKIYKEAQKSYEATIEINNETSQTYQDVSQLYNGINSSERIKEEKLNKTNKSKNTDSSITN
jgi:hypothetical protein